MKTAEGSDVVAEDGSGLAASTDLQLYASRASTCVRCGLAQGRTTVVFGDGDPRARLLLVGEAPGLQEDRQGLPFVGPSGQLLERLLAEIGLQRDDVYICNVVKCRPPANRPPQPLEIGACRSWLDTQLRLVSPAVVLTLGNVAAHALLATSTGITRLRGRSYPFEGRDLVPTFHPAAALRAGGRAARAVTASAEPPTGPLAAMREDFALAAQLLAEAGASEGGDGRTRHDGAVLVNAKGACVDPSEAAAHSPAPQGPVQRQGGGGIQSTLF